MAARLAATPLPGADLLMRLVEAASAAEQAVYPAVLNPSATVASAVAAAAASAEEGLFAFSPLASAPVQAILSLVVSSADAVVAAVELDGVPAGGVEDSADSQATLVAPPAVEALVELWLKQEHAGRGEYIHEEDVLL